MGSNPGSATCQRGDCGQVASLLRASVPSSVKRGMKTVSPTWGDRIPLRLPQRFEQCSAHSKRLTDTNIKRRGSVGRARALESQVMGSNPSSATCQLGDCGRVTSTALGLSSLLCKMRMKTVSPTWDDLIPLGLPQRSEQCSAHSKRLTDTNIIIIRIIAAGWAPPLRPLGPAPSPAPWAGLEAASVRNPIPERGREEATGPRASGHREGQVLGGPGWWRPGQGVGGSGGPAERPGEGPAMGTARPQFSIDDAFDLSLEEGGGGPAGPAGGPRFGGLHFERKARGDGGEDGDRQSRLKYQVRSTGGPRPPAHPALHPPGGAAPRAGRAPHCARRPPNPGRTRLPPLGLVRPVPPGATVRAGTGGAGRGPGPGPAPTGLCVSEQNLENDEDGVPVSQDPIGGVANNRDPSRSSTRSSQWSFSTLSNTTQRSYHACCSWTHHPLVQKNRRVVLASFLLLLLGLGLILVGVGLQVSPSAGISSAIFFVPGFLLLIPGVYHVIFIYCAVKGHRGFQFFYLPYFEK
uniref:Transmembrane protein 134 n=1 Tax=Ornithorhynchus anatinus TaxID=9258 RepID=A0A6I8NHL9_ORNAN